MRKFCGKEGLLIWRVEMKKSGLFLIFLASLLSFSLSAHSAIRYLFVLHNLGETNALTPVIDQLPKGSYAILALGKAAEKLQDHPCRVNISSSVEKIDVAERLTKADLHNIQKLLKKPSIVISGMASKAQAQILNTYKKGRVQKIIYYDNFDPLWSTHGIKEYLKPFYETLNAHEPYTLVVPGTSYEAGAKKLRKFSGSKVVALGQPSLETWEKIYEETDRVALRTSLSIAKGQRVILYAGGYDPQDVEQYKKDFETFVKGAAGLKDVRVLVTYHPKTDGAIEKETVQKFGNCSMTVIEKGTVPTPPLSTIADVVSCFKSTIGAQAAYMGKPVLYVANKYENFLIDARVALIATTPSDLQSSLETLLKGGAAKDFSESLGIPKNASVKMKEYLERV
jgi:hypothetical protein